MTTEDAGVADGVIVEPLPGGRDIHYGPTFTMVVVRDLGDEEDGEGGR